MEEKNNPSQPPQGNNERGYVPTTSTPLEIGIGKLGYIPPTSQPMPGTSPTNSNPTQPSSGGNTNANSGES